MKTVKTIGVLFLSLLLAVSLFAVPAFADGEVLIDRASEWEYVAYEEAESSELTAPAPAGWLDKTDGESWSTAQAPFAAPTWAKDISNTLFDWQYYSAFLRKTVNVKNASEIGEMFMDVIYDENPVLYINGVEVWSASGYKDADYVRIDLSDGVSALKEGENVICVFFSNVYGGGLFDLSLSIKRGEKPPVNPIDEDGHVVIKEVTTTGFVSFGGINDPANVLDMNQDTVTGSAFNGGVEQSVTLKFLQRTKICQVFVQCKDEGTTISADGLTRGDYKIFAYDDDLEIELGDLKAVTGTDGGNMLTLDEAIDATSVKIRIDNWDGDCWACVADVYVVADGHKEDFEPVIPGDNTETPSEETPSEETPSEETPSEETPSEETPSEETPSEETPSKETPSEETPSVGQSPDSGENKQPEKKNGLPGWVIPVIAAGAVLIVAAVVAVILISKKKKKA